MRKLVRVVALTSALMALPAVAGAQTLQAGTTAPAQAQVMLAAFPTDLQSAQNMPKAQAAAILGGAAIVGAVADTFLEGGLFTVAGILIGAVGGNAWYEQHYWPF